VLKTTLGERLRRQNEREFTGVEPIRAGVRR
jgi:hypothetical protein